MSQHFDRQNHPNNILLSYLNIKFKPLMPGGNKKVTHTYANLQLSDAGVCTYM